VLRIFPEPTVRLAAGDVYADISFPERKTSSSKASGDDHPSAERPYVLINTVASLDGKATVGGKAGSIGSSTDRTLMRNLRARADAVMVGAGTLRAEKLTLGVPEDFAAARKARGLKPQPLAVVVTGSGNVPLRTNLIDSWPGNLLVLVSSGTPEERLAALSCQASVEAVPGKAAPEGFDSPRLDLAGALETLKRCHAVDVLLVEGGPALNHALVCRGLVDELFLTLAPKLLGGDGPEVLTILEGPALESRETEPSLVSAHLFGGELFLRYSLCPPGPSHLRT
jgi:2,5-diamino-6-(ribosylamino)-4(3H)-pyrimidinone 5'-phosphate reductase